MPKDIRYLKGVGEKRAELFAKKGIKTVEDLLYYFPRSHEDRTEKKDIADCVEGETVCVSITVFSPVRETRVRRNMLISTMIVSDESGVLNVVWYNNRYVKNQFKTGDKYVLYGKVTKNRGKLEMVNPVCEQEGKERFTGKIVPLYPLTSGLTQKILQSTMELAIKAVGRMEEYIPSDIREKYHIAELNFAMKNIHFPENFESYNIARERFVFEELLVLQLALSGRKDINTSQDGIVFEDINCVREFTDNLPFSLTNAQKKTLNEILKDCRSGNMMNRLVQGDVGSGKTAVAAAAIYTAVKNGHQAAMMAPTEILATQHAETLAEFFKGTGITVVMLTGSMRAAEKKRAYDLIATGVADVVVGTHAIIQDAVEFYDLAFVVADEQHRFGVEQRAKLAAKGNNPHMLIMSATPIPRTLALILYGDLDISVIDELPPGRKPVKTYAVGESMRKRIFAFLQKNVSAGMQAYVVCPLIEETETSDLQNAEMLAEKLQAIFPEFKIGLMHGKMKAKLKEEVMDEFGRGEINILVSTTVIEVGVNVPNANIMVIENAERFGLSQLHQLRGRVGRGNAQAFCILFAHGKNEVTKKRMETMCISNDGFYISEQDLKLRGPGDFFGTRQHGLPEMRIANLFEDRDILAVATEEGDAVVQVFFVRSGKLIGREHFYMTHVEDSDKAQILLDFVKQFYAGTPFVPRELILQKEIDDIPVLEEWLTARRGARVYIRVPRKGQKEKLVELAEKNAKLVLEKDRERIARDEARTVGAVRQIAQLLDLPMLDRMEAFDISNISGFENVGSMVVYEKGKPKRSDYRKFRIKTVAGPDDYACMREVLTRRFEHGLKETKELEEKNLSGEFGSFARFPDLLLMDGGRGQVNIAQQVLDELHLNIPVCGMVKDDNHRTRGLYFHNVELPIDRNSEAFKLITRVQDEAHRFAIEYHRSLRSKDQVKSVLDEIPGVGPARRKALMKSFPSIYEIRDATAEQIAMQADLPMSVAEEIYEFFHNHQEEDCRE